MAVGFVMINVQVELIRPGAGGDLDAVRDLRRTVFVQEQGVPESVEMDERDGDCFHLSLREKDTQCLLATGRMLPEGRIGRMAVRTEHRRRGLGQRVLRGLLACAADRGLRRVSLHAQKDAVAFYTAAGFSVCGDDFIEAGILHTPMERSLEPPQRTLASVLDELGLPLTEFAQAQ